MTPVLFDSHFHLTADRFDEDRDAVLRRAVDAGVTRGVTVASDLTDARAALALASATPGLWATAGIHPHEAAAQEPGDLAAIEDLHRDPKVVAVGETGLDYYYDHSPRDAQLRSLEAHVDLAERLRRPLVIHCRDADEDMTAVLRSLPRGVSGVLHCFVGGDELLDAGLDVGWYVSFSGIASFRKFDAAERVRRVPLDRLLVETDAPYLAPVPMRGKRNEPAFVAHVCAAVAGHLDLDPSDVARATTANALRMYGLPEDAPELVGEGRAGAAGSGGGEEAGP
jgi:TatD DNase family protein